MPSIKIPNLMGGHNYAVEPHFIADNQLSGGKNVDSLLHPPSNSLETVENILKAGLSSRSTFRRLDLVNAQDPLHPQRIAEFGIVDPSISATERQFEIIGIGKKFDQSFLRVGGIRNQTDGMTQSKLAIYYDQTLSYDPVNWICEEIGQHLALSAYGFGGHTNLMWNGTFESQGTVSITDSTTTVTGVGTNFQGQPTTRFIGFQCPPYGQNLGEYPGLGDTVKINNVLYTWVDVSPGGEIITAFNPVTNQYEGQISMRDPYFDSVGRNVKSLQGFLWNLFKKIYDDRGLFGFTQIIYHEWDLNDRADLGNDGGSYPGDSVPRIAYYPATLWPSIPDANITGTGGDVRQTPNSGLSTAMIKSWNNCGIIELVSQPGQDIVTVSSTPNVIFYTKPEVGTLQGLIAGACINFNNETTGGLDDTGWYRIVSVASDTSMTIYPAKSGTVSGVNFKACNIQQYDPLQIQWTVTAIARHKGRTIIASTVFGLSYLYVTEPDDPYNINAGETTIQVGGPGEVIQRMVDLGEMLLIQTTGAYYGYYLNTTAPEESQIIIVDKWNGGVNETSAIETPFGGVIFTTADGMKLHTAQSYISICDQLKSRLLTLDDTLRASVLTFSHGHIFLGVPHFEGNPNTPLGFWIYDIAERQLFRYEISIDDLPTLANNETFHLISGRKTFDQHLKMVWNGAFYEYNYFNNGLITSQLLEADVDCQVKTKTWTLADSMYRGVLKYMVLEYSSYDRTPIIVTPVMDGIAGQSYRLVPKQTGYNRELIKFMPHSHNGITLKLQFDWTQSITNQLVPTTLYRGIVLYDLEGERIAS